MAKYDPMHYTAEQFDKVFSQTPVPEGKESTVYATRKLVPTLNAITDWRKEMREDNIGIEAQTRALVAIMMGELYGRFARAPLEVKLFYMACVRGEIEQSLKLMEKKLLETR